MAKRTKETLTCQHCGAEADITVEEFEKVEDVIKRTKKTVCKTCGQEIEIGRSSKDTFACQHCGAEADMTIEDLNESRTSLKGRKSLRAKVVGKRFHGRRRGTKEHSRWR